ncbi:Rad52/Rad22 family DNA repair protein [Candidatus Poribacteria bacterium]
MDTQIIEQEFDKSLIKTRKGRSGNKLSYIEVPEYIKRLNMAFDYNWSFDIEKIESGFVVVRGKLTAEGISKSQYGTSQITLAKDTGEIVSIGDDFKAAGSDALKKCSSLFGIGLHLYNGSNGSNAGKNNGSGGTGGKANGKGMNKPSGNKGNGNVTKAQLSKIKSLRTGLGMSSDGVLDLIERMYSTRDPKELNKEMAIALISVLEKKKEDADKSSNEEEVV